MTKKAFIKMTTYAAIFGLIGGASFEGVNYAADKLSPSSAVESPKTTTKIASTTSTSNTTSTAATSSGVSAVAQNVLPSIVAINVTISENVSDIFGRTYKKSESGSGSGIIVGQDKTNLYIVTNNHVVADATSVSVTFNDKTVSKASVKGTNSDSDLAVVQIPLSKLSEKTSKNIKVATLGDSTTVKVGEQAIAIGNALGYGTSVTVGYISAKDRTVSSDDVSMKLLQTDAAINPGNSGGALVDAQGKIIGINSSKYASTDVEGMGFAIPISTAIPIINQIISQEKVSEDEQGYLGIQGTDVSDEYSKYYNIPKGVYVSKVTGDSPAEKAGIQKGDVIVSFNGNTVTSMADLQTRIASCKAGDTVKAVVKRLNNGTYEKKTFSVTLGSKKDAPSSDSSSSKNSGSSSDSNADNNSNN